jgi:hypothetical protein
MINESLTMSELLIIFVIYPVAILAIGVTLLTSNRIFWILYKFIWFIVTVRVCVETKQYNYDSSSLLTIVNIAGTNIYYLITNVVLEARGNKYLVTHQMICIS